MATKKISELTELTTPDGTEELVVNDSGTSKKITQTNLLSTALPKAGGTMTGTIAGFTSTGIDDNATSTAITIDSAEQVGIGTESPSGLLHISGSTTTTLPSIVIERTGSGSSKWDIKPYADTLTFRADATTDRLTLTNDGRGLSQFTAKAWCQWGQIGTQTIADSHNVSSITDVGTGNTKVNFSNAMSNNDYSAVAGGGWPNWDSHVSTEGYNTSYVQVFGLRSSGYEDNNTLSVTVFGD